MIRSRCSRPPTARLRWAGVAVSASALLVAGQLASIPSALAGAPAAALAGPTFVDLGTAASYSVLGGTGVANTGAGTVLSGDLGLSPGGVIAGFPPGTVQGTIHDKDAAAETAQGDVADAYADAAGQASTTTFTGDQGGKTFQPGVHTTVAAFTNTGTITLDADGDSSAVFVFQVGAAFSSAAASKVVLADGALANNVFWQVAGAVSLGASAKLVGTFLGAGAITFGDGASIKGRALTPGTVAVTNSPFVEPIDDLTAPLVSIDGGPSRSTNDTTPPISGATDEPPGKKVTVTVDEQTLTSTVGPAGRWTISTGALTSGPHDVLASITDASQNIGTATQVLTVDTSAPNLSINGGASAATNDVTPSISGTTDEPAGTTVDVVVAGQTLTAAVGEDGSWVVDPTALAEATHSVVASVEDAAHNIGTASQILDVDVTLPVVSIDGGPSATTVDTSPWIYGRTAEKAGTIVHVAIGGQALTATVSAGGGWGVSATTLSEGLHHVVASITDQAQNTGTASQDLTVGTSGPVEPTPVYRPDAAIRVPKGSFVGGGIYGVSHQQVVTLLRGPARSATFLVRVTNKGNSAEPMSILGTRGNAKFRVSYTAGGSNVTGAVAAGAYRSRTLSPGESATLAVKLTRTKAARVGDRQTLNIRAGSSHSPSIRDTVKAVVRVAK